MASLLKMESDWSIRGTGKGGATAGRASENCSGRQSSNVKAGASMWRLVPQVYKKILIHLERKIQTMARKLLLLDRMFKSPIFYPKAGR